MKGLCSFLLEIGLLLRTPIRFIAKFFLAISVIGLLIDMDNNRNFGFIGAIICVGVLIGYDSLLSKCADVAEKEIYLTK